MVAQLRALSARGLSGVIASFVSDTVHNVDRSAGCLVKQPARRKPLTPWITCGCALDAQPMGDHGPAVTPVLSIMTEPTIVFGTPYPFFQHGYPP